MMNRKAQAIMSPAMIMSVVVSLIILAVGVYAFFTTVGMIPQGDPVTRSALNNTTAIGNQVFNVVGVVLVIGSIMLIVTMVYSYMRPA